MSFGFVANFSTENEEGIGKDHFVGYNCEFSKCIIVYLLQNEG